jgi:hypothetical protein
VITRVHTLAWAVAAVAGGALALACETKPAHADDAPSSPHVVWDGGLSGNVEHFWHHGNDCYVYLGRAIACTRAP